CMRVARDLQRDGYVARTIGVTLRYDNFRRVTRDQTIAVATNEAAVIRRAAAQCLRRVSLEAPAFARDQGQRADADRCEQLRALRAGPVGGVAAVRSALWEVGSRVACH